MVMGEEPGGDERVMVAVGRTKVVRLVVLVRRILRVAFQQMKFLRRLKMKRNFLKTG